MLQINASIARHDSRIWCAYRTRNLYQFDAGCFLTELDDLLEPVSEKKLLAEDNNTAFEDVRLFAFEDKLLAFYTYLPYNKKDGWSWEYGIGYGEVDVETGVIINQISLRKLSKRRHEKNWSPYIYNNELFMVTDFDPFIRVIKLDTSEDKGTAAEVFLSSQKTNGWEFGELRGGTPLLSEPNNNDGWCYGFVHSYQKEVKGFKRFYYYTVVRFNHLSKVFEYHPHPLPCVDEEVDEEYMQLWLYSNNQTLKVIFPIGIMPYKKGVLISFGKDDVSSYTEYFSWERIKGYFKNSSG